MADSPTLSSHQPAMADSSTCSPTQTDNPRSSEPEHNSLELDTPATEVSVTASKHSQDLETTPTEQDVLDFIQSKSGLPRTRDPSSYIVTSDQVVAKKVPEEIQKNPNKTSFASFGDQGTTASVSSDGQIIQITKYLPAGRSKFFSVDRWSTPAPHKIQERADDLMDNAINSYSVGFALKDFDDSQLDFVCDRWPRFTGSHGKLVFRMQYFVCDGTVFQQFVLENQKSPPQGPADNQKELDLLSKLISEAKLHSDILIRDLDWQDKKYQFNTSKSSQKESYSTELKNDRFSLVRTHKNLPPASSADASPSAQTVQADAEFSVELVMTTFVNGIPQRFRHKRKKSYYSIDISTETARAAFDISKCLEITVAYKLQLAQPKRLDTWKSWLIPALGLDKMRTAYSDEGFRDVSFADNELFDFKIRRNLEHILSVCSVPISNRNPTDYDSETSTPGVESERFRRKIKMQEQKDNPIALTCGDMSGHLIVSAAGFSAFQFLIAMHRFLQGKLRDPTQCTQFAGSFPCRDRKTTNNTRCTHCRQVESLARRIRSVCKGHMDLVFKTRRGGSETNVLVGKPRPGSFIDGATKLIMAQGFYSISSVKSAKTDLPETDIKKISDSWFKELERAEKRQERGPCAFARSTDELTNNDNYYLEDHCWIWTALKGIETTWPTLDPNPNRKEKGRSKGRGEVESSMSRIYSSKEAQRHILKHFTTEHSAMNRRMLAVFRSSSETRFIFRSRDTALFHCMGLNFFNMAESELILDVWRNTLLAQAFHEDNQSNEWVSPLKYTLALIMACKGWQINRSSINETFKESTEVLLANAGNPWANGLFPGSLNSSTKAPEVFRNAASREAHWIATFEVPYVLWMHAKEALEQGAPEPERKDGDGEQEHQDSNSKEIKTTKEISVTGKRIPFNNLIDQRSIAEPPDEWLYNEPDFLTFDPKLGSPDDANIIKRLRKLEKPENRFRAFEKSTGVVVDIRRSLERNNIGRVLANPLKDISMMNSGTISRTLQKRGADSKNHLGVVKKRFVWLPYADTDTAEHCCFATSNSEKENMISFFERHCAYENFFFDDTTAALNTWNTELQLAFYQLHEESGGSTPGGMPRDRQVDFPVKESNGTRKKISRATMGFRFDGDFFDRYWNCHFIEYKPGKREKKMKPDEDANQDPDIEELISLLQPSMVHKFDGGKQPWRQRKVLELILFDRILEEMTTSTENIVNRIRTALKIIRGNILSEFKESTDQNNAASRSPHIEESVQKKDVLEDSLQAADFVSKMKGEDYLEFSKQSQAFEQVLRVLDDDLGENMEQIERWKNREQDRAPEQPRWSRNDELRYRTTITKMLASNSQKMRRLDRCRSNIQSLKTSLESTREYIRDDLNLRGAEDVRLFTYVTATFLPISFATSIFSMGEFPGGALLGSMIGLAVFSLLLTAVALVHDKKLAVIARLFKSFVLHIGESSSREKVTSSRQDKSDVKGKSVEGSKDQAVFSYLSWRRWGKYVKEQEKVGTV